MEFTLGLARPGHDDIQKTMEFIRSHRKKDIVHLPNRNFKDSGDLVCVRSGGNLEQMMMLSELCRAVPISNSDTRTMEVKSVSDEITNMPRKIEFKLPLFLSNEPYIFEALRSEEIFVKIRNVMAKLSDAVPDKSRNPDLDLIDLFGDLAAISDGLVDFTPVLLEKVNKVMNEKIDEETEPFNLVTHGTLTLTVRTLNQLGSGIASNNHRLLNSSKQKPSLITFGEVTFNEGFEIPDVFDFS